LRSLGWTTIQAEIEAGQLLFFARIAMLEPDNIYKRVARGRWMHSMHGSTERKEGPTHIAMSIAKRLGTIGMFNAAMENGAFYTKGQWKRVIKECISDYDKTRWQMTCHLYEGMDLYMEVMPEKYDGLWPWWQYGSKHVQDMRRCRLLLRLCTGDVPGFEYRNGVCQCCQLLCIREERPIHMLFECRETEGHWVEKWGEVESVMPEGMKIDIRKLDNRSKFKLIASGMGRYVEEWNPVYHRVLKFVEYMCFEVNANICDVN
jgi:hypothetical protein